MKNWKRLLNIALCLCLCVELLPVTVRAAETDSAQEGAVVTGSSIKAWKTGATTFNVNGVDGDKTYQTTFQDVGYETMVSVTVGANRDRLQRNPSNLIATGLRLDVDLKRQSDNYIMVQYTLKNSGARTCDVKLGGFADVMIDMNDHAPISTEKSDRNTLHMSGKPKNKYAFKLVATGTDTLWYGRFSSRRDNCFTDLANRGPNNVYKEDSALAYSWNARVAPGEVWSRCVLIGTGSLSDMKEPAPSVPPPEKLIPDPSISLTTKELYLTEGDALPNWGDYVASSVGDLTRSGEPTNSGTPGVYTVTYTAKSNNKTARAELKVNILPRAAELSRTTVAGTDNFSLSATMNYTGGLTWTETGFVYGVIAKPTLTQNDGVVKTGRAVSAKGGALNASVPKGSLVEGLQYYARAYAKASDGTVLYGDSSAPFGVGVPNFGTFSVINNGSNTFTVSRTGGSDGVQTVYYRTVNGSAVGGTHFTHQAGTLTFKAGETTKTITITENTANRAYSGKPATAYSNADRTYSVEIYRVTGGGGLGSPRSATRTMKNATSYQVARDYYTTYKNFEAYPNEEERGDNDSDGLGWYQGTEGKNGSRTITVSVPDLNKDYWKNTATGLSYYMQIQIREVADGYQHIQITPGEKINTNFYPDGGSYKGFRNFDDMNPAAYAMILRHGGNGTDKNFYGYTLPSSAVVNSREIYREYKKTGFSDGGGLLFPVTLENISIGYSAGGSGSDKWIGKDEKHYIKLLDTREPQFVAVAPMADGTYQSGDTYTVSLIFDEIVDKKNSSTLSNLSVNTSWGTAWYSGGADTNVLYFTGKVEPNASGALKVTGISNAGAIKDMCAQSGTATGAVSGTTTATLGTTAKPTVTVGAITNNGGALSGTITAANAVKLEYTWSDSTTLPAYGWVTSGSKASVTVKTARGAGTYYLHARATNSEGVTVTAYKSVTIPATGTGAAISPELTVSLDNTAWAKTRPISVNRSPADAKVTVKTPGGSTAIVTGGSYTAKANGVYTFTLTSGSETVTRQAVVSRIDTTAPTITINDLPGNSYPERITLTFSVTDGGSGVKNVTAKWGTAAVTPTKNSDGTYSVTCPNATGTYLLTVTAGDKVDNSASAESKVYRINLNAPTLTVIKGTETPTGVTYSYSVDAKGNSGIMVCLPDGRRTAEQSGTFTLTEPGAYLVSVTDAVGHFVSKDISVTEAVDGVKPDVRLYADDTDNKASLFVEVEVYEAGSTPTVSQNGSALTMTDKGGGLYAETFPVTEGGVYRVTATDTAGNTGEASVTVYALVNVGSTALKISDDGTYGELPTPTRTDYRFDGWYTAAADGTKAESNASVGSNYTLYARWMHSNHTGGTATIENKIDATCTTDGSYDEVVRCTVCNAEITREKKTIPAKGHTGGTATCQKKAVCRVCNQEYGDLAPHNFDTSAWGYRDADGHAHLCQTDGCTEHGTIEAHVYSDENDTTCNTCSYIRVITPSHTHSLTLVPAVPATCVSPGNIAYYRCAECGALFADSAGTQPVTEDAVKLSPLGHAPSGDWSHDESSHWRECQKCGQQFDLAAHVSSGPATETDSEVCMVCGYVIQAAAGHTHNFSCQVESETYLKAAATCTNGAIYYKSCACGAKGTETFETGNALGHTGGTATCTEKPVCTRCHQAYGDPLGHAPSGDWSHDESSHWHKCQNNCGEKLDLVPHVYGDDSDETCNTCGYRRDIILPHIHSLTLVLAVPATCSSAGNIEHYRCTVCGKLFRDGAGTQELTAEEVVIEKLSHTPEPIPAVPATCEQSGMTEGSKCSVCQEVITAQTTIPALNHDWQAATCETPKTCTRCHVTQGKALGHIWGRYIVTVDATQEREGEEMRTCARDDTHKQTRAIPKLPASTYGVSGEVHESGDDPAEGVNVTLVLGDREIASTTTDDKGKYSFGNVAPGVYNLVAKKGGIIMTVKVEVISKDVSVDTITMPKGKTNSVIEVKSDNPGETVEAVVGNLETVFKTTGDDKPFTGEDQNVVNGGGSVEIKLTVTKTDTGATSEEIKKQLSDKTNVGLRLELKVSKTVTEFSGSSETTPVTDTDVLLETIIRLPAELQGKDSYTVYRLHGTDVHTLTAQKNANGEFIEVSSDGTAITIHAKLYSEYVIAYQERGETGGNGGGNGGGNSGNTGGNGGNDNGGGRDDNDDSYTPPSVPAPLETNIGYRACRRDDTCPIWPFADAAPTAWYHDGVHYCIEKGLMHGISADKFLPDGSVTRAQLAAILWRLEGNPAPVSTADFSDVADGAWYAGAVRWAADSGVVKGYADGRFRPNDAVTREQVATLLYRFAGYKGYDVSIGGDTDILRFTDGAAVGGYAVSAMRWACGSGLMTGAQRDGGMALAPRDTTTRAQTATLLTRFQSTFAKEP